MSEQESRTGAELRSHGWTGAEIFRAVDRGLLQPHRKREGAWTYWEFRPADGHTWDSLHRWRLGPRMVRVQANLTAFTERMVGT